MKTLAKSFLITIILFQSNLCLAQSNYPIKEQYDKHNKDFVDDVYNPCNIAPPSIPNTYGDGMSYVLESYIRMYETTKDKAYLIKFIINSICMHENRQDVRGVTNDPRWAYDPSMYQDGLIIWAMSHFVHLVIYQEPTLYDFALPQIPGTKITNNVFGATFNTYGDFAQWLRVRSEQTLGWYTYGTPSNNYKNYWGDDERCYTPEQDPSSSTRAQCVNQQAGFACALFYFGITNPNTDYLHKAAQIAKAYKGTYKEKHPGFLGCLTPTSHTYDVLYLLGNTYIWKANGWREITCNEYNAGTNDYEDISHAIQTLIFPRAINNRLESNGVMLFYDNDMILFRNTFSFNIYAGTSSGCPQIHAAVDGDDEIKYRPSYSGLNTLSVRSLAWMPFYKYDSYSTTPNVYDIIMNYYACDILNNINNIASGTDFYGLSEVVAAQWDKECVNLTLYNRDVIYDQDFIVKNKLVVAPQDDETIYQTYQTGDDPFAEPKTFTDAGSIDRFVIEPGITANMVAGETITMKTGVHIKANSNFRAYIAPNMCTDGMRRPNPNHIIGQQNLKGDETEMLPPTELINSFNIYPNPSGDITNISFSLTYNAIITLEITDLFGNKVFSDISNQEFTQGNYTVPFDGSNLAEGIYICTFYVNGKAFKTNKIVLIK